MDLHADMFEPNLMQVAVPIQGRLLEHGMETDPHRLGWQDYSGDKNKQSPAQVRGNNEHNPNQN